MVFHTLDDTAPYRLTDMAGNLSSKKNFLDPKKMDRDLPMRNQPVSSRDAYAESACLLPYRSTPTLPAKNARPQKNPKFHLAKKWS